MGVFLILLSAISGLALTQARYGRVLLAREQALDAAEGGLEYYRWFLAHNPNNLTNGTGLPGPYTYTLADPEGGTVGNASLSIAANSSCGVVQSVDITSRGTSAANPGYPRTLFARYAKHSVAEYSYLLNSNVWAGSDRQITGPYFSNGGIRMDGTNNSTVQSAVSTWSCDSSFGCSPTQSKPGVFGNSGSAGAQLWSYPAASFDFNSIATNFATLQGYANTQGMYLAPTYVKVGGTQQGGTFSSVGGSDQRGFHLVFNSNGTVSVYLVTGTSYEWSIHIDDTSQWQRDYHTITSQTLKGTYAIPAGCAVIYSQAKTWVEGTVAGKVTVVAADTGSYAPDIILNNNIGYTAFDGSVGLSAIAEHSVLIPYVVPDTMTIRGTYVAQSGYFGRNLYDCFDSSPHYDVRTQLNTYGTVVSNQRTGTKWTYSESGCGTNVSSGFNNRVDSYDRLQAFLPPPFTPSSSADYGFIIWREQ
jgi:hypothetical protein